MYNLTEIKKIKDEYEIEEVNCLERPVAMVLNSYCPIYRNLYLFHEKMNRCYNLHFYDWVTKKTCGYMGTYKVYLRKASNKNGFVITNIKQTTSKKVRF